MSSASNMHLHSKHDDSGTRFGSGCSRTRVLIFVLLALVIGFVIGILIGKFAISDEDDRDGVFLPGAPERLVGEADPKISQMIMDAIDPARIEANLKELSLHPHIAGKQGDFNIVKLLSNSFQESGLQVRITPYDVLLSYPSDETPNSVRLLYDNDTVFYDSVKDESNFSQYKDVVPPFNAYSPSRLVQGQLVYAGYGRVEDYIWLKNNSINVKGNLVIVKYGKIFRGDKVNLAAANGAIGVILYSDPADCTGFKIKDLRIYPETWWLPPTGAQRGTIFIGDGDPLTPSYPANDLAYRYKEDSVEVSLPTIPCHPIGYGAAIHILRQLTGLEIPESSDFYGGLNITYKTGPGFIQRDMKIQLNVTTQNQRAKAENVFGIIKGHIEPDRYVLYGNHRDAWIYGAVDPSSGTAVMMETARVMGDLVKRGVWRPRRTIIFCSWGAEEFGLVGSTEWVEQYVTTLRERAVAYINIDTAVAGNDTLSVHSTPLMYNIMHDAAQKVKNPNQKETDSGRTTVYDTWLHVKPWNFTQGNRPVVPLIGSLGSGSDYAPLLQKAGITSVDISYTFNQKVYKVSGYPLYHTEYETFDIVKEQMDRNFECHAAVGRVSGEVTRVLADSLILPFNLTNYAAGLEINRQALDDHYGTLLRSNLSTGSYEKLKLVIEGFTKDVSEFEARKNKLNKLNPFSLRELNDQILLLEKAFLHPDGLPNRPLKKHLIFAESVNDAYAASSFPGLVDLLFEIEKNPERWEQITRHFHTILNTIQSAGVTLREVSKFMPETL